MSPSSPSSGGFGKAHIKFLDAGHGIAYIESGTGNALVFVHGSLCDYRYWLPQLTAFAADYHAIAPSLSHYYPRLPSAVGQPFSWRLHVEQLSRFLALVKEATPAAALHLVGHSRGACIAYRTALVQPKLLSSLTLVDPGGPLKEGDFEGSSTDDPTLLGSAEQRNRAAALIEAGEVDIGLRLFVDSTSQPGTWDRSPRSFQAMARDNASTLAPQLADLLPPYTAEAAGRIGCPTLLVDGALSPEVYRHNAAVLAGWIPQSRRATIEGASHGMTVTHSQAFNRALRGFLESCR